MDTRERLVESTRDLLWERGYSATSPKLIQERAGAGQGSMYHHFSGKAALAAAAIAKTVTEQQASAEHDMAAPGTSYDKIASWLLRERKIQRGCRVGRLVQEAEVLATDELREPLGDVLAGTRARLTELVRAGVAAGDIRDVAPPEIVAATLLAVLQGGYVTARAAGNDEPFTAATEGLLALLKP